jgi:hypothetical protein
MTRKFVPEWDAPLEELCAPLSAKVDPRQESSWSAGIGSGGNTRTATTRARQSDAMMQRRINKRLDRSKGSAD